MNTKISEKIRNIIDEEMLYLENPTFNWNGVDQYVQSVEINGVVYQYTIEYRGDEYLGVTSIEVEK